MITINWTMRSSLLVDAIADDSIAFGELQAPLKSFGFKSKNVASIFQLLVAILLLGMVSL
jgi:myosin heavy subunit